MRAREPGYLNKFLTVKMLAESQMCCILRSMEKYISSELYGTRIIAMLKSDGKWYCIPKFSRGNSTEVSFLAERTKNKFATLNEAIAHQKGRRAIAQAQNEDRLIFAGKLKYI